jgi:ketosteroid isomerase-like protein
MDVTIDSVDFRTKPLFQLTQEMLDCVRDYNFERLAMICDDDYGIVDINTAGRSEIIRDRAGWENWFTSLFEKLKAMQAKTWSEITNYEVVASTDMAYSVVDFDQYFIAGNERLRFGVLATIVWKKTTEGWREARYHSSLKTVEPMQ